MGTREEPRWWRCTEPALSQCRSARARMSRVSLRSCWPSARWHWQCVLLSFRLRSFAPPGPWRCTASSGEEDDAYQSQFTAFESMDGSVDVKTGEPVLPGELADEYYVDLFEEIAKAPETQEAVEEVEDAVAVAGKEHEILAAFANDVPDDSTHAPFLSAKEQMGR